MPLKRGKSKEVISENIAELTRSNKSKPAGKKRSREQIARIAFENARRS